MDPCTEIFVQRSLYRESANSLEGPFTEILWVPLKLRSSLHRDPARSCELLWWILVQRSLCRDPVGSLKDLFIEMLWIPLQVLVGRSCEFPQKILVQRFCEPLCRDLANSIQPVCMEIERNYFRWATPPTLFGVRCRSACWSAATCLLAISIWCLLVPLWWEALSIFTLRGVLFHIRIFSVIFPTAVRRYCQILPFHICMWKAFSSLVRCACPHVHCGVGSSMHVLGGRKV